MFVLISKKTRLTPSVLVHIIHKEYICNAEEV